MNAQSLDEQQMRRQDDQDVYARSAPSLPREAERTVAAPATVLVFRDQRKQEVENYAIVGPDAVELCAAAYRKDSTF